MSGTDWRISVSVAPPNVAAVALANKTARVIWVLQLHDRQYEGSYVSAKPI